MDDYSKIMEFDAGSALYGTWTPESDSDTAGLFIEHPHKVLGLDKFEHHVTTTADGVNKNTSEDHDQTFYSLRKWAWLACKGNPTALSYLFVPVYLDVDDIWLRNIGALRKAILAKSAVSHFFGFVQGQMKRLTSGSARHGQRPSHPVVGYDTKAGMHAYRLMSECCELLKSNWITYPRPEYPTLLDIRQGMWSLNRLEHEIEALTQDVRFLEANSSLQDKPNRELVTDLLTAAYIEFWHRKGRI